jgi:hypothetical protein
VRVSRIYAQVDAQHRLWCRSHHGTLRYITADFLERRLPGFARGRRSVLLVEASPARVRSYHSYNGGPLWIATLPPSSAKPGDRLRISAAIPDLGDFTKGLTSFSFTNSKIGFSRTRTEAQSFALRGGSLQITFSQAPAIEGVSSFVLKGRTFPGLKCVRGIARLGFSIKDIFGSVRSLALYHDGHNPPAFGIHAGSQFYKVSSLAFDGIKLAIGFRYRTSNPNVVTLYETNPLRLYRFHKAAQLEIELDSQLASRCLLVRDIYAVRRSEGLLMEHGRKYQLGRAGAEIAYCIANRVLHLSGLVLNEPSKGGRDLYTNDGLVTIQSRLLTRTLAEGAGEPQLTIRREISRLIRKLAQDFEYNPRAEKGCAILTYLTKSLGARAIIVETLRPKIVGPGREGQWARPDLNRGPLPPA